MKRLALAIAATVGCSPAVGERRDPTDGLVLAGGESTSGCATHTQRGEPAPLFLFAMMDQSMSMAQPVPGGTKWSQVTAALSSFAMSPDTRGVSLGIQYFGLPDSSIAQSGSTFVFRDSCDPAAYGRPEVEIQPLPDAAKMIIASLGSHSPISGTPTTPALQGAHDYARAWAAAHQEGLTAVLLATDGEPYGCNSDIQSLEQIAAASAAAIPKVLTFVVGFGAAVQNLTPVAELGGTDHVYLIDPGGDVTRQFTDALLRIQKAVVPCEYRLPEPAGGAILDTSGVNVRYTPGKGSTVGETLTLQAVAAPSGCQSGFAQWYYDDPIHPAKIVLCPPICDEVTNDATSGSIDVVLGCRTQLVK